MSQFTLYRAFIKQRRPSGSTGSWQDVLPLTISWTDGNGNYTVLEDPSTKCGYEPQPDPIYRWVNIPINQDYECDTTTYTKYYRQKKQVSMDNGATWNDVSPAQYQRGAAYESQSIDCGYVAPTEYKATYLWAFYRHVGSNIIWYYYTGTTPCNSDTTLSSEEIYDANPYKDQLSAELSSVTIGECVEEIGSEAFYRYKVHEITIPDSVTVIGYKAFSAQDLGSITLPNNLKSIGAYAFEQCHGLTEITIPSSVVSIGEGAFYTILFLESITCLAVTPPTLLGTKVFDDTNNCPIYVPAASVNAYKTATNWSEYASRIFPIGS